MRITSKSILAVVLSLSAALHCFGVMDVEEISAERLKTLGLEIRGSVAGPTTIRVELELKIEGELKDFKRVDLQMREGEAVLASASLLEDRSKPGRVTVSFAADRSILDQIRLRVVVQHSSRDMEGYEIRPKRFLDMAKLEQWWSGPPSTPHGAK